MAAERTLTERELNRALLARQHLLERAPAASALPRVVERVGLIQAQYAPSMYVGLWSRVAGLEREAVTRGLERRTLVQATLMRITIHLASRRDLWPIAHATREARRVQWLRSRRGSPTAGEMGEAAAIVRARMAGGAVLRRTEIEALVGRDRAGGVGLWVDLVRAPPGGTWARRRADVFALAEDWVAPPDPPPTAAEGVELLVRRYLGGFGPAAPAEIANWAGLAVGDVDPVLERMTLRRFRTAAGGALVDLPRAPLPSADTPAPVRFLPTFDATLLVHARRTQILPEEHRPRIFNTKMPQSAATFLVDGQVAGTWRMRDDRLELEPFSGLDATARRALEDEGERLRDFHRA